MALTETEQLQAGLEQLEHNAGRLAGYRQAWDGVRPAAWLSAKSREALGDRLTRLGVNLPRLGVRSLAERLRVNGFTRVGQDGADPHVYAAWRAAGLVGLSDLAHTDRLLYGAAYVTVWTSQHDDSRPVALLDSPLTATVDRDPATGELTRAIRRWESDGVSHALTMTAEQLVRWRASGPDAPASSGGWQRVGDPVPNVLGVIPMTDLTRRASSDDWDGTSYVADVLDISDALAKVLGDAMVTSEYFARPRRWATGLEIVEDEDGNPIDPFGERRLLQSEDPETEFGQLAPARLDGYSELVATLTQQAGALLGLPAHYLGLHGDQPPNAESVRAAEQQLVSTSYSEHRQLDPGWGRVAALLYGIARPAEPLPLGELSPLWASPEARTPAQAADSATKLHGIGVPLAELLVDPLGYTPERAARIAEQQRSEQLTAAATRLAGLRPGQ